jgi:hypothetical protein
MKLKPALIALAIVAMTVASVPASWANSLTYQNVTFDLSLNGSNDLVLSITNATNATGDWVGIDHLEAFAINQYGTATGLGNSDGWSIHEPPNGLSSGGCTGTGNYFCADGQSFELTNSFSFTITHLNGAFSLDNPPGLKVLFSGADVRNGHGNLLSQPIGVPEPASLLLLGAGLAGIGIWSWRRKVAKG